MTTSEFEYYLLSELVGMPNRVLAQQIELLIWNKSPIPNEPILEKFLEMLRESEGPEEFYEMSTEYINGISGIKWHCSITDNEGRVFKVKDDPDFAACPWFIVTVSRQPI
jgi:hypothetical protein